MIVDRKDFVTIMRPVLMLILGLENQIRTETGREPIAEEVTNDECLGLIETLIYLREKHS